LHGAYIQLVGLLAVDVDDDAAVAEDVGHEHHHVAVLDVHLDVLPVGPLDEDVLALFTSTFTRPARFTTVTDAWADDATSSSATSIPTNTTFLPAIALTHSLTQL
jgi:catechol-2,3-dioxygenase